MIRIVRLFLLKIFETRKYLYFKIVSLITFNSILCYVSVDENVKELNLSLTAGPMHISLSPKESIT